MKGLSWVRIRAIYRKELREYRRNRSVVAGMAILPIVFCINPLISIFALPASSSSGLAKEHVLLYLLGIPAIAPSVIAAYTVAGERQQGTLEPVLTTPIRRNELVLAKALAVMVPSLAVAYAVYAFMLILVVLFARPAVASAVMQAPDLIAQVLFTPLLAGWAIWTGIAISTRASDVRVAQQLGTLASLPTVALTTLVALGVIPPTTVVAIIAAAVLLIANRLGWRLVTAIFDRERLVALKA
jgi:ABC-2 type transport system permease protein